jgi:hypothetical protein
VWVPFLQRLQLAQTKDSQGNAPPLVSGEPPEAEGDVLPDCQVGEEGIILEDHPNAALLGGDRPTRPGYHPVSDLNVACVRHLEPHDEA